MSEKMTNDIEAPFGDDGCDPNETVNGDGTTAYLEDESKRLTMETGVLNGFVCLITTGGGEPSRGIIMTVEMAMELQTRLHTSIEMAKAQRVGPQANERLN